MAWTRSFTRRVDMPPIQASWITATKARSLVLSGSRKGGKSCPDAAWGCVAAGSRCGYPRLSSQYPRVAEPLTPLPAGWPPLATQTCGPIRSLQEREGFALAPLRQLAGQAGVHDQEPPIKGVVCWVHLSLARISSAGFQGQNARPALPLIH